MSRRGRACPPAEVALDAGADWVHEHGSPSGAFSLGSEDVRELCPAGIEDGLVEPGFRGGFVRQERSSLAWVWLGRGATGHGGRAEFLQGDRVVLSDERVGGPVVEVVASVADLTPLFRQSPAQPSAVPGPEACPFLAPLQIGDRLGRSGEKLRIGKDLTIGGGQEPGNPQVNTHAAAHRRQRHGISFSGHDHVPASMFPLELEVLHGSGNRPVLAYLDRADCLERRPRPPARWSWSPLRAVTNDEPDLVEPAVRLESWVARLPLARPRIERGEHHIEPTQRPQLRGERVASLAFRVGAADVFQLGGLHTVADTDSAQAPCLAAFFQRGVVQVAVVSEQARRSPLLRACGVGTELESPPHRIRPCRNRRPLCGPVSRRLVCVGTAPAVARAARRAPYDVVFKVVHAASGNPDFSVTRVTIRTGSVKEPDSDAA
jgi:hypothetical protein